MQLDVARAAVILLAEEANLNVKHAASVSHGFLYPQEAEEKWAFTVEVQPNFISQFNMAYGNFVALCRQRIRAHGYVPNYVILSEQADQAVIVMTTAISDVSPTAEETLATAKLRAGDHPTAQAAQPVVPQPQNNQAQAKSNGNGHVEQPRAITLDMGNIAQALAGFDKWFTKDNGEVLDHDDYRVEDYELSVLGGGNTELTIYLHSHEHRFTRGYIFQFDRHFNVIEATPGNEECMACMREAHDNDAEANRLWDEGR